MSDSRPPLRVLPVADDPVRRDLSPEVGDGQQEPEPASRWEWDDGVPFSSGMRQGALVAGLCAVGFALIAFAAALIEAFAGR